MDEVVNKIVGDEKSLVCIGATDFHPNSPIKGHIRTPGLKTINRFLKKKSKCDVLLVDEYRTSQTCGKCLKPFDRELHKVIERRGHRYRMCIDCTAITTKMVAPDIVVTDKSKRKIRNELRARVGEMRLLKKIAIVQNNHNNFQNNRYINTVWNRDICAARVILHKGKF